MRNISPALRTGYSGHGCSSLSSSISLAFRSGFGGTRSFLRFGWSKYSQIFLAAKSRWDFCGQRRQLRGERRIPRVCLTLRDGFSDDSKKPLFVDFGAVGAEIGTVAAG